MAVSGPAGSGQSAAAEAALVTAQSGMSALAGRRRCPDGEIDAMGRFCCKSRKNGGVENCRESRRDEKALFESLATRLGESLVA
jgi:hypothetical protein